MSLDTRLELNSSERWKPTLEFIEVNEPAQYGRRLLPVIRLGINAYGTNNEILAFRGAEATRVTLEPQNDVTVKVGFHQLDANLIHTIFGLGFCTDGNFMILPYQNGQQTMPVSMTPETLDRFSSNPIAFS